MLITVACGCGKRFGVRDGHAGKRVRCPGCGAAVTVPSVEPESTFVPLVQPAPDPAPAPAPDPRVSALEARVARLERLVRRVIAAGALGVVAAVSMLYMRPGGAETRTEAPGYLPRVEAGEFALLDHAGAERAVLKMESDGQPSLSLKGHRKGGVELHLIGKDVDAPGLVLRDERGRARVLLSINASGGTLAMSDQDDHGAVHLGYNDTIGPHLSLQDWKSGAFA